jgi:hypothetical protein
MTRINLISPEKLYDQHLLAEHRELKRIPNVIKSWKYNLDNIPEHYVLWTWHVKFFYNKLKFLHNRYKLLFKECKKRWFNITNYEESFSDLPEELYNDYSPSQSAIKLNKKRLQEKIDSKPDFYKYYWNKI